MTSNATMYARLDGIDLMASVGSTFVLNRAFQGVPVPAVRFIPQFCYIHLRSMTGTLTQAPGIRVGTNGAHNNVCPVFVPPTSIVVGQIGSLPLAAPIIAPPVDASDVIVEITQAPVGVTAMTADILLLGLLVS